MVGGMGPMRPAAGLRVSCDTGFSNALLHSYFSLKCFSYGVEINYAISIFIEREVAWALCAARLIVRSRGFIAASKLVNSSIRISGRTALRSHHKHSTVVGLAQNLVRKRDFYAGGLMILFGLVMALKGPSYRLGTLMHMGPGFLPTVLGVILISLGIAIAGSAVATPEGEGEDLLPEHREWWAWGCILASPLAFMLFGAYGGMIPGTFACVFVAAMGDREATLKSAVVLAALVTVFGVGLFSYILQIPMPVLAWRGL